MGMTSEELMLSSFTQGAGLLNNSITLGTENRFSKYVSGRRNKEEINERVLFYY
jgi:hypothetical protein